MLWWVREWLPGIRSSGSYARCIPAHLSNASIHAGSLCLTCLSRLCSTRPASMTANPKITLVLLGCALPAHSCIAPHLIRSSVLQRPACRQELSRQSLPLRQLPRRLRADCWFVCLFGPFCLLSSPAFLSLNMHRVHLHKNGMLRADLSRDAVLLSMCFCRLWWTVCALMWS